MLEIPLATLDFCAQRFSPKVKILIIIFVYIFNTVNCLRFEFPFHISYLYYILIFVYIGSVTTIFVVLGVPFGMLSH